MKNEENKLIIKIIDFYLENQSFPKDNELWLRVVKLQDKILGDIF